MRHATLAVVLVVLGGSLAGEGWGAAGPSTSPPRDGVTLARAGQPTAIIILAAEPTRAAQFAAYELQHFVRRISGAQLAIMRGEREVASGRVRIFVGDSSAARAAGLSQDRLGPQEYAVRFLPTGVVLAGRDAPDRAEVSYSLDNLPAAANWPGFWEERGTLHAVYDFLEKCCAVRWFNPTDSGTLCPRTDTLIVRPLNLRRRPGFEFRDAIGATGDNPGAYDAYVSLWPGSSEGFRRAEALAYPELHRQYPDAGRYAQAKRMACQLFLLRMRNGGQPVRCNHSLYGYYQRFWEQSSDPAAAKLFVARRPGMFAHGYEGQPPQMCYTSRELIDQLVQDARDYYDGRKTGGELGIFWQPRLPNPFPVEPMDNSSFCKCDACQQWLSRSATTGGRDVFSTGIYSDYFFHFINEVQQGLSKTHPDKSIVTLAYASHAMMPTRVKLDPRVAVQFCFAANRSPASRTNYEHELQLLKAWGTEGVRRPLYLWLYYTFPVETANNGKYHCFPGFFAHTIGEQFKLFHKYGYRGMFHCGYGQDVEAYVTFKLMDDPTLSVDALLHDYFTGLYGPAGVPLQAMYEEIERIYCDPANYPQTRLSGAELAWGHLGTGERMSRLGRLLRQAQRLAQTDERKQRVALFAASVWDYMLAGRRQYLARSSAPIPNLGVPRVAAAGGEVARVAWNEAQSLGSEWFDRGGDKPSARKLSGRIAHDGQFLYLELTDPCPTARLSASAMVFPYDDWEVFLAAQRATPYRQYAVGPTGLLTALSHGEVNFRPNVPLDNPGVKAQSDTSAPDRWVVRLALPLATAVAQGVPPGGSLYMNILRVSSPAVSGQYPLGLDTWISYCTVHEVDRLAELKLAK